MNRDSYLLAQLPDAQAVTRVATMAVLNRLLPRMTAPSELNALNRAGAVGSNLGVVAVKFTRDRRAAGTGKQRPAAAVLGHDPEKACPGLDPGWQPVFRKDHAPAKT